MSDTSVFDQPLVFGLDIGTRNVVGTVGYKTENEFVVVAQYMLEHETRAMLDGQIHDILPRTRFQMPDAWQAAFGQHRRYPLHCMTHSADRNLFLLISHLLSLKTPCISFRTGFPSAVRQ